MTRNSLFRKIFGKLDPIQSGREASRPAFKAHEGEWLDLFYSGRTGQGIFYYHENLRSRLD